MQIDGSDCAPGFGVSMREAKLSEYRQLYIKCRSPRHGVSVTGTTVSRCGTYKIPAATANQPIP